MKRLLKTFPDKSSSYDNENKKIVEIIKEEVVIEINSLNQEINFETIKEVDDGFKILAKLLKYLRNSRNLKLLTICRQIQKIEIKNLRALIIAEESVLDEIFQNDEHGRCLKEFFEKLGLSLVTNRKNNEVSLTEKLSEWLGDKLIIK